MSVVPSVLSSLVPDRVRSAAPRLGALALFVLCAFSLVVSIVGLFTSAGSGFTVVFFFVAVVPGVVAAVASWRLWRHL